MSSSMTRYSRNDSVIRLMFIGIGLLVFALDVVTKWWVHQTPRLHYYPVIKGFFTIHYVQNEGIAFGLFHSVQSQWKPILLSLMAIVAVVIVVYYLWTNSLEERGVLLALSLLEGGILGNFSDRLLRGYVVDFLELHWKNSFSWPTFNVADAAITSGVFIILYQNFFGMGGQTEHLEESRDHRSRNVDPPSAIWFLIPALFSWLQVQVPAQTADQLEATISRLQKKHEGVRTFSARFQQRELQRSGRETLESGIVMMKRPGKMYWEYEDPTWKLFITDGKNAYLYVPRDKQVTVSELDLEEVRTPLLFLIGRGDIDRDFSASWETEERPLKKETVLLRLTPRRPQPEFIHLLIELFPDSSRIHRLAVIEPIGHRIDYTFTEFKENPRISDSKFRLKVPSEVEIIEQSYGPENQESRTPATE